MLAASPSESRIWTGVPLPFLSGGLVENASDGRVGEHVNGAGGDAAAKVPSLLPPGAVSAAL
ncbi:hypothetical protein [Kitasatospora sp. KL5]|uniref:hypothetical protein n=1 Tax=Kitasatospora sp. KL5 TaxID=3425125 RepID=UPI003D6E2511